MRPLRNFGLLLGLTLLAAWPAASQMMGNMPSLRGVWNPVVGSGAAYQVDGPQKMEMEIAVVGKEDVNGKTGYWIEMGMNPSGRGQMYVKNLEVIDGKTYMVSRMITQMAGQPPMEMPVQMFNQGMSAAQSTDIRDQAQHVGTEDVTTPAGTFSCDHYRTTKEGWDVWLSTQITPWGLVKSTGNGTTIVLSKVLSNATDHITGTPQKFDPSQMMRGRGGAPPQ